MLRHLRIVGPGLVLAATGVGAGDLVAAAVSGSRYGLAIAWAVVVGAALKYLLTEGVARWQLATGTTLLEGWARHLGRWVQWVFLVYLVLWSFVVGGALISACGLAAHALAPGLSVNAWGILHSLVAAALVLVGRYRAFENTVKLFIALMFVTLVGASLWVAPPLASLGQVVRQAGIPSGGVPFILAVVGGVGGSVTVMAYGYWMRERGWEGQSRLQDMRLDLVVAYLLTGIFGLAVMVVAAQSTFGQTELQQGSRGLLSLADVLDTHLGPAGRWTFLVGFWGAVATSLLGVWQGIPYLFCDFVGTMRGLDAERLRAFVDSRSRWYRGYLFWLSIPPLVLLWFGRPVALIVVYSVVGALFMPFLCATLVYMNRREAWVGELRTGPVRQALLVLGLLLFAGLAAIQIARSL